MLRAGGWGGGWVVGRRGLLIWYPETRFLKELLGRLTASPAELTPLFSEPSSCSLSPQFDMQRVTLEELKHILYHAFRDHLTMKDIENIIINEEESLNETSGNCQTEFEGGG